MNISAAFTLVRAVSFYLNRPQWKIVKKQCNISENLFLWKIYIFQQSHFWVHFALNNTGRMHYFLMEILLTRYCSFYKFLSADLPNSDFHSFYNFLSFQKSHFLANFPRFRPLKNSFFSNRNLNNNAGIIQSISIWFIPAEEESYFSSLALQILKSRCKCFGNQFTFVL